MRKFLAIAVLFAFAVLFWMYHRDSQSRNVRAEMIRLVDDMDLSVSWREETRQLVRQHHKPAFDKALDVSRGIGEKFDAAVYQNEVFDRVIEQLRGEGQFDLADKLSDLRKYHRLVVTER